MSSIKENNWAAPCGLFCGACVDYLVYKKCHGCGCDCGECAASAHHKQCNIYNCCVKQRGHEACCDCQEFPCSMLIQSCYNPVWLHHLSIIENLRRRKATGTAKWLKEQKETWSNEWYLGRWLWFQRECENRLKKSLEESKDTSTERR